MEVPKTIHHGFLSKDTAVKGIHMLTDLYPEDNLKFFQEQIPCKQIKGGTAVADPAKTW